MTSNKPRARRWEDVPAKYRRLVLGRLKWWVDCDSKGADRFKDDNPKAAREYAWLALASRRASDELKRAASKPRAARGARGRAK